jgi:hypothetical protein
VNVFDRLEEIPLPNYVEGERYDLERDPTETDNRWDDEACADVRADLLGTPGSGSPGAP